MKKSLLLGIALIFCVSVNAQTSNILPGSSAAKAKQLFSSRNKAINGDQSTNTTSAVAKKAAPIHVNTATTATQIGETQYDLQSNSSMGSRIIVNGNGTISAVWTICPAGNPYTARGTGYNYFDGSHWLYPDSITHNVVDRLESLRTGFPALGKMGTPAGGNRDVVIAHATANYTLQEGTNLAQGASPFTFFQTTSTIALGTHGGAIWPRLGVGGPGDSTLHVIANYSDTNAIVMGVKQPMVYSRSLDGGVNWDKVAIALPGYDSTVTLSGGGEDYSIDARGNDVAIIGAGLGENVSLWKSNDNGNTFTKTLVDAFPYAPDYGTLTPIGVDTLTNDGSSAVMLDPQGKVHVAYGLGRVGRNTTGDAIFVPGTIGLIYWNENTQVKTDIPILLSDVDVDGDGLYLVGDSSTSSTKCRYGNNSILCKPTIGMAANGTIYIAFSLIADNDTTADNQGYRDIWVVSSSDQGATWSCAKNLTAFLGASLEQAFPVLAKNVDGYLHIIYQEDQEPGTALTNADPDGINTINYLKVDVSTLVCNVGVNEVGSNDIFNVGQNFPNPLNGQTTIPVYMNKVSNLSINVSNMLGQKVLEYSGANLNMGYHNIGLDASKLTSGIYFYTVKSGNYSVTKRMIVE